MTPAAQQQMTLTFHQQTDLLQHHASTSLCPTFANEMSPVPVTGKSNAASPHEFRQLSCTEATDKESVPTVTVWRTKTA